MNTTPIFDELCITTAEKLLAKLAQVVDRSDAIEQALAQNELCAYHFTRDYYWSYCTPENIADEKRFLSEGTKEGFATVHYARDIPPIVGYRSEFVEARLKATGVDRADPWIGHKVSQRTMAEDAHIKRDQPGAWAARQAASARARELRSQEAKIYALTLSPERQRGSGKVPQLALSYFCEFGFLPMRQRNRGMPFAMRDLSANVRIGLIHRNAVFVNFSTSYGSHGVDIYFEITGDNGAVLTFRKGLLDFLMGIRIYHECSSFEEVHLAYRVQQIFYAEIVDLLSSDQANSESNKN